MATLKCSRTRTARLAACDDLLLGLRRTFQGPSYRSHLLEGLPRGVELATLRVLRAIQRADVPPSVGDVAVTLDVDPSTASRLVDRAVASDLVERRACHSDGRRTHLYLRPEGQEIVDEVTRRRLAMLGEATSTWSVGDLDQAIDLLGRLQDGFDALVRHQ